MAYHISNMDSVIMNRVDAAEEWLESKLSSDVLYYYGELRTGAVPMFRDMVEKLKHNSNQNKSGKPSTLTICLTTPGGQAEAVEKMVEIIRHHYDQFYAIVPRSAMSAGTILCMAADKIFMDYASSLGPIDPQVPDRDNTVLVPALGYLDKVDEMLERSANGTLTPAEFEILQNQDLAMLSFYEQSKKLSISLLKKWLTEYKFKDWNVHRSTNPGTAVTREEKEARAEQIAAALSNNQTWHSHGRMIGMDRLRSELKLEIEDYGLETELRIYIREYCDTLTEFIERQGNVFYIHNRNI